jgi:hypothetical protein
MGSYSNNRCQLDVPYYNGTIKSLDGEYGMSCPHTCL